MTRPLHIVHTESSCGWGGQEIRTLTEAQGMIGRGHRVTLVCPQEAQISAAAEKRGIPLVTLPIARKNISAFAALRGWLRRSRREIDVINSHSSTDSWLVALACATLADTPPIVRTRHVSSPVIQNGPTMWLYQRAATHLVTTGEALREQLHRDNYFRLESMTSVPTGINLDWFAPDDKSAARTALHLPNAHYLGILGTLRNWKGHTYLLESFSSLNEKFPDWRLLIIGDGPQRHNLERRVAELGLADKVRMTGNQDDVPLWLNALDVFVLPSYGEEGVPQSIMQAMACGLPVVSTPVGAIREALVEGETGLIVAPKDSVALAQALARLMQDDGLRNRFGAAGLARARARFGIDIMLDKMENIFQRHARSGGNS
jgi:glycosyltransferase involved in cell wall biosynthesis